jgi:4-amino-4-deoxy-L-arabinose transferase-like glycosyltransferase
MDPKSDKVEERKKKVISWLKQPTNLMLLAILILAFSIRLYYFVLTSNQPLWWDELAYGSLSKNLIHHLWDNTDTIIGETHIRPPLFPFFWSLLLRAGFNEAGVRFILEFIPSALSVFFVYLLGKEFYNKNVGLIAAFIFSVLWIHLFYTGRLLTHVPELAFLSLSIFYFFKSQKEEFKPKYFALSLFLLCIATLIRYPCGIVFFVYLAFLILSFRTDLIKLPKFYFSGIIGTLPLLIFFVYNKIVYNNIFPALLSGDYVTAGAKVAKPIAFNLLNYIPIYLQTTFFLLFLLGIVLAIFELVLGFDMIKRKQNLKSSLFLILILLAFYSYFIFYTREAEDRWLFPTSLSLVILAGFGVDFIYRAIKKYLKSFSLILILILLVFGAYNQIIFADSLIKEKQQSFLQMKQGFEWIKDNTPKNSTTLGSGIEVYSLYYAERYTKRLPEGENVTFDEVNSINADYLIVHAFGAPPAYLDSYLQNNSDKWSPVHVVFFDSAQTQPAVIIYKRI